MFRKPQLSSEQILICGAGIAGLALARQLKKLRIPFKIIERRNYLATEGAGIALPANAVKALRYIGVGDRIDQEAHQVNQIIYTDSDGSILSAASLRDPPLNIDKFVALPRHKLHDILREGLDDVIHFDTTIKKITQAASGVLVTFNDNEQEMFSAVIGADGIHSQVRQLVFGEIPLDDLGVTIWRWVSDYSTRSLQPTYMIGLRDLFMAYPIGPNEVYCYAHIYDPENIKAGPDNVNLLEHFGKHGEVAQTMLKLLTENQFVIPGRLRSVPQPMLSLKRVALIGDAAHACSPMLQQGAAAAFEDVIALSELLKHFPTETALNYYQQFRIERVNWICKASDDPMKNLIYTNQSTLKHLYEKISKDGPLNVQGWKKLLAEDYLTQLHIFIHNQIHLEVKSKSYSPKL